MLGAFRGAKARRSSRPSIRDTTPTLDSGELSQEPGKTADSDVRPHAADWAIARDGTTVVGIPQHSGPLQIVYVEQPNVQSRGVAEHAIGLRGTSPSGHDRAASQPPERAAPPPPSGAISSRSTPHSSRRGSMSSPGSTHTTQSDAVSRLKKELEVAYQVIALLGNPATKTDNTQSSEDGVETSDATNALQRDSEQLLFAEEVASLRSALATNALVARTEIQQLKQSHQKEMSMESDRHAYAIAKAQEELAYVRVQHTHAMEGLESQLRSVSEQLSACQTELRHYKSSLTVAEMRVQDKDNQIQALQQQLHQTIVRHESELSALQHDQHRRSIAPDSTIDASLYEKVKHLHEEMNTKDVELNEERQLRVQAVSDGNERCEALQRLVKGSVDTIRTLHETIAKKDMEIASLSGQQMRMMSPTKHANVPPASIMAVAQNASMLRTSTVSLKWAVKAELAALQDMLNEMMKTQRHANSKRLSFASSFRVDAQTLAERITATVDAAIPHINVRDAPEVRSFFNSVAAAQSTDVTVPALNMLCTALQDRLSKYSARTEFLATEVSRLSAWKDGHVAAIRKLEIACAAKEAEIHALNDVINSLTADKPIFSSATPTLPSHLVTMTLFSSSQTADVVDAMTRTRVNERPASPPPPLVTAVTHVPITSSTRFTQQSQQSQPSAWKVSAPYTTRTPTIEPSKQPISTRSSPASGGNNSNTNNKAPISDVMARASSVLAMAKHVMHNAPAAAQAREPVRTIEAAVTPADTKDASVDPSARLANTRSVQDRLKKLSNLQSQSEGSPAAANEQQQSAAAQKAKDNAVNATAAQLVVSRVRRLSVSDIQPKSPHTSAASITLSSSTPLPSPMVTPTPSATSSPTKDAAVSSPGGAGFSSTAANHRAVLQSPSRMPASMLSKRAKGGNTVLNTEVKSPAVAAPLYDKRTVMDEYSATEYNTTTQKKKAAAAKPTTTKPAVSKVPPVTVVEDNSRDNTTAGGEGVARKQKQPPSAKLNGHASTNGHGKLHANKQRAEPVDKAEEYHELEKEGEVEQHSTETEQQQDKEKEEEEDASVTVQEITLPPHLRARTTRAWSAMTPVEDHIPEDHITDAAYDDTSQQHDYGDADEYCSYDGGTDAPHYHHHAQPYADTHAHYYADNHAQYYADNHAQYYAAAPSRWRTFSSASSQHTKARQRIASKMGLSQYYLQGMGTYE